MDRATTPGTLPACIALRPTVVATVVEDGAVLLDLDSKYFYSLNESAWALVQLCETGAAVLRTMIEHAMRWGASEQQTLAFLNELAAFELIDEAPAADGVPPVTFAGPWSAPSIVRHADPLQTIVTSAFDPSIPLAE